jgi:hypothetical protein
VIQVRSSSWDKEEEEEVGVGVVVGVDKGKGNSPIVWSAVATISRSLFVSMTTTLSRACDRYFFVSSRKTVRNKQ